MRYKVGDRVKIKSLDWYNKHCNEFGMVNCKKQYFVKSMTPYCGSILTIIVKGESGYLMNENGFRWTDEMIEGLAEGEDYNMKNTCYNKEKCKNKFCIKCDEFWKNANSVQRGLAITIITVGACLIGILTACIFMGVYLILTR